VEAPLELDGPKAAMAKARCWIIRVEPAPQPFDFTAANDSCSENKQTAKENKEKADRFLGKAYPEWSGLAKSGR